MIRVNKGDFFNDPRRHSETDFPIEFCADFVWPSDIERESQELILTKILVKTGLNSFNIMQLRPRGRLGKLVCCMLAACTFNGF